MTEREERLAALAEARALRDDARRRRAALVRKLALDGKTPTEIQRQLDISNSTIRRVLASAGIRPTLCPGHPRLCS